MARTSSAVARHCGLCLWLLPALAVHGAELRAVLGELSRAHGFVLEGEENLAAEEVGQTPLRGDLATHIRQLLQRYNYLMVARDERHIEKVVIIGTKPGASGPDHSVRIHRDGLHHRVDARLTGVNGQALATTLIIDTGASSIVLPASMIERLGFRAETLVQTTSRTASGTVPVKAATLAAVAIGEHEVRDVAVSFVEDGRLGDLRLLGMSFLRWFQVTIDDQNERLILIDR